MGYFHQLVLICTFAFPCSSTAEDARCSATEGGGCTANVFEDTDEQSAVAISLSLSRSLSSMPSFAAFIEQEGRTYAKGSTEYDMRRGVFEQRIHQIHKHNSNPHRRWNAGVNHMTDRTETELAKLRGLQVIKRDGGAKGIGRHSGQFLDQIENAVLQEDKSWTHLEAVKARSDQSHCGSCWAVATATVLRANAEINGHSRTFSPQELVDCVPNPHHCGGEGGCKGSTVELALNWVMEQGLDTLEGTPYKAEDSTCKKSSPLLISQDGVHDHLEDMIATGFHGAQSDSSAGLALGLRGWERLPENEYEPLMRAVAQVGPVAVSVAAHSWHSYSDGIFDDCNRDAVIDHAVTLVGYGKDKRSDDKYWIVKNSWGNHWGEKGNIRLFREEGKAHCGTDHQPEVGTGCDGGPSEVRVCGMCGILYDSVVPHFDKRV